jgi:hypothetical protein
MNSILSHVCASTHGSLSRHSLVQEEGAPLSGHSGYTFTAFSEAQAQRTRARQLEEQAVHLQDPGLAEDAEETARLLTAQARVSWRGVTEARLPQRASRHQRRSPMCD